MSRIIVAVIAFANIKLPATFMTKSEFGIFLKMQTFCFFVSLIFISPIGQQILTNISAWKVENTVESSLKKLALQYMFLTIIGTAIELVCLQLLGSVRGNSLKTGLEIALYVFSTSYAGSLLATLNVLGRIKEFSLLQIVATITQIGTAMVYSTLNGWTAGNYILGNGLGAIIACAILNGVFKKNSSRRISSNDARNERHSMPQLIGNLKKLYGPTAMVSLIVWLAYSGNRIIIADIWGNVILGSVGIALALSSQSWSILETLYQQFFLAKFYQNVTVEGAQKIYGEYVKFILPIYIATTFALLAILPIVIKAIFPEQYEATKIIVEFCIIFELSKLILSLINLRAQIYKNGLNAAAWMAIFAACFLSISGLSYTFNLSILEYYICISLFALVYSFIALLKDGEMHFKYAYKTKLSRYFIYLICCVYVFSGSYYAAIAPLLYIISSILILTTEYKKLKDLIPQGGS